ncbi:hypothetical protein [Streptomyces coeruleorubidus]
MAPDAGAMPQQSGLLGDVRTGWQGIVKDSGLQPFIQNASTPTSPTPSPHSSSCSPAARPASNR